MKPIIRIQKLNEVTIECNIWKITFKKNVMIELNPLILNLIQ